MPKGENLAAMNRARAGVLPATSSTYTIWRFMRERCENPKHKDYANYGARGITVCDRWKEFANFVADMGERPTSLSLDRRDNSLGYSPDNCRWATNVEQARNRRTNKMVEFRGESKPIAQWAEELGIERKTLQMRLNAWSVERALTTPYIPRKET